MAKYKRIRGTRDIIPSESHKWRYVERVMIETAAVYGFKELRTPLIEKTELFTRSVGDTTDIVQKEMYSFDKGHEHITIRPEMTAGVVRAVLENNLLADALPAKLCYIAPCFRHENPQAGRYRQFHQFGLECFGSASPSADAEVISMAAELFDRLGVDGITLNINSIGCHDCRPEYHKKLVAYYTERKDKLCPTCIERLGRNPLRLLDCKESACHELAENAPKSLDNLCGDCAEHFEGLKTCLDSAGISYIVNPFIVRGLDYYTKTVFEFVSERIGAQSSVGGGGRYDPLVESMGGPSTPGMGFGMGIERLLMVMESCNSPFPGEKSCDIYIGSMGESEYLKALSLARALRSGGFYAETDIMGRSVKAQMKYADKIGAAYSCVIGSNELEAGKINIKNMSGGDTHEIALDGKAFVDFLKQRD